MDGPTGTAGDYWTYAANTTIMDGFYLEGQTTLTLASRAMHVIEGASVEAYELDVAGGGTARGSFSTEFGTVPFSGQWILTGTEILETGGLKVVSSVLDLRANGTLYTEPFPLDFRLTVQNTTRARLLEDSWTFPVEPGDTGSARARYNASQDVSLRYGLVSDSNHSVGSWEAGYEYEARAESEITVPVGALRAVPIEQRSPDGTHEILSFAPAVGNYVRTEVYNETGHLWASMDLVAYRYQVLEPPSFLGIHWIAWAALAPAVAAIAVAAVLRRRRSRLGLEASGQPPRERPPPGP